MRAATKWTEKQDAYLASNYATAPMIAIIKATGRTMHAIHARARSLGLKRPNKGVFDGTKPLGRRFAPGQKPWNFKETKPPTLRDKIIALFAERRELTIGHMHKATGSTKSACWRVCETLRTERGIHISRYQPAANSAENFEAVYCIGVGADAEKPTTRRIDPNEDAYEIQPIPRPVLGLWGLVWNTNSANGAHQEKTA